MFPQGSLTITAMEPSDAVESDSSALGVLRDQDADD
jgi:hypothetical protein